MSKPPVSDSEFARVYNDVESFETIGDVADQLGLSKKTVKNKAASLRKKAALDDELPKLVSRAALAKSPMSEDATRFMEDWGPEECIGELRRVAEIDPDKVVTRNYFRVHSLISESTWNRYFGTFEEFKRQASIKLSRQQHALERNIAVHASVDHYRELNRERELYANKYDRKNNNRFKTVLIASDIHDIEVDQFWLRVFIDTAERVHPDVIVLVGDVFDLPEFGKYNVDPREWDVVGRIKFAHEYILGPLREACPATQIDIIEGNHEARLLKLLADATPALRAVLSDLHGMSIATLLGLDEYEINYIAKADLSAWTKREHDKELGNNYKVYWETMLFHHFPYARNMGLPGCNGHHHSHQVWPMFSPIFGAYEWHQLGCGHKRSASYTEGEKWHMGFALAHADVQNKLVNFEYIPVTDIAVVGGQWYYRGRKEKQ